MHMAANVYMGPSQELFGSDGGQEIRDLQHVL